MGKGGGQRRLPTEQRRARAAAGRYGTLWITHSFIITTIAQARASSGGNTHRSRSFPRPRSRARDPPACPHARSPPAPPLCALRVRRVLPRSRDGGSARSVDRASAQRHLLCARVRHAGDRQSGQGESPCSPGARVPRCVARQPRALRGIGAERRHAARCVAALRQDYAILNCDDHAEYLRKHKRDPADYRPDILHQARSRAAALAAAALLRAPCDARRSGPHRRHTQALLSILDSPLNKAGRVKVRYAARAAMALAHATSAGAGRLRAHAEKRALQSSALDAPAPHLQALLWAHGHAHTPLHSVVASLC